MVGYRILAAGRTAVSRCCRLPRPANAEEMAAHCRMRLNFWGGATVGDELGLFSRLVLMLQGAALGANLWDAVVSEIVAATGGSDGILFSPELPPSMGGFWASRAIPVHHMETYATHYCSKDVWCHFRPNWYPTNGLLITDEELIDPVSTRRSEYHYDFLKSLEVGRLVCGAVHPSDSPTAVGRLLFCVFKPMNEDGFDPDQQDLVKKTASAHTGRVQHVANSGRAQPHAGAVVRYFQRACHGGSRDRQGVTNCFRQRSGRTPVRGGGWIGDSK